MTDAPTRLVWESAGRPSPVASVTALLNTTGTCRMCGLSDLPTAPADKALGTSWTDHSCWRQPASTLVCAACLWACSGRPPATIRMWSTVCAPGVDLPPSSPRAPWTGPGLCLTNRGNTRPIIDLLSDPPVGPWLVTVAMSGQKHVLPYGTVNQGRSATWTVRMEDTTITAAPAQWQEVHQHAVALRRLGVRDSDILTGTPGPYLRTAADLAAWAHHAARLTPYQGSPLLRLALWTITKEII